MPSKDDGPRRIGKNFSIVEDSYATGFISQLKDCYVIRCASVEPPKEEDGKVRNFNDQMHELERKVTELYLMRKQERYQLPSQALFIFIAQSLLIMILAAKEIFSSDASQRYTYPSGISVVVVRFICAVMLHLTLSDEMQQGLNMMKFASNMSWMFDAPGVAWLMGFCQFLSVVIVEVANLIVLTSNASEIDVVMNFLAFSIILEFDNLLFKTQTESLAGKMVEKQDEDMDQMCFSLSFILKYYVTTSRSARYVHDRHNFLRFNERCSRFKDAESSDREAKIHKE